MIEDCYSYLRQFTPDMLRVLSFAGSGVAARGRRHPARPNASGARAGPHEAPSGFVPVRWRGYLDEASAAGNTTAYLIPPGGVARAAGRDAVRLDEAGELVIGPLTAEDLPVLLPFAPIVSALIELDRRTGFLGLRLRHPVLQRRATVPHQGSRSSHGPWPGISGTKG